MQSVKCVPTRIVCTHFEDINKYIIVRTLVNVSDIRVHIIVIIIICIYTNDIGEGSTGAFRRKFHENRGTIPES